MLNKTCMLGIVTIAAAIGLVSAPARAQNAASVGQSSDQQTVQAGYGNTSVQGSAQTGIVSQKQVPFGNGVNAAGIGQDNSQGALQQGYGNTSVQGSAQTGIIKQGNSYQHFPYSGGINASDLKQSSGQALGQLGIGNSAVQASDQGTAVHQH
jgi:hypothetical protein